MAHRDTAVPAPPRAHGCGATLSPRELEVLQLSATGHKRRQIADALALSQSTVKTHLEHIYAKLGVSDRASAVGHGLRHGLID